VLCAILLDMLNGPSRVKRAAVVGSRSGQIAHIVLAVLNATPRRTPHAPRPTDPMHSADPTDPTQLTQIPLHEDMPVGPRLS
jgi:hypothetical protein